jgi:hypothetical protein
LSNTIGSALSGIPTDPAAINANTISPLTNALKSMQTGLTTLVWVGLAIGVIGDLALGHIIYSETRRLGTPVRSSGILLLLTALTGPLGMLVFVLWRYLGEFSQVAPAAPSASSTPAAPTT